MRQLLVKELMVNCTMFLTYRVIGNSSESCYMYRHSMHAMIIISISYSQKIDVCTMVTQIGIMANLIPSGSIKHTLL